MDRIARGESAQGLPLDRTDEWGVLSSKLSLLGEQMRGEKAAFVALKENLDQLVAQLTDGLLLFDKQDRLVLATPVALQFLRQAPHLGAHPAAEEVFAANNPLERQILAALRAASPSSRRRSSWETTQTSRGWP